MEMYELVVLLLPLAALSGWFAARAHYSKKFLSIQTGPLAQAYRHGLNYLLDEKTDKALAAVETILEHDQEPLETHIALGNLFRRRGEVEKAIEIHERLMLLTDLSPKHRAKASFELGKDYMGAGLFDRAEHFFTSLRLDPEHGTKALQQLLLIFESERDWKKAIQCVDELATKAKPAHGETRAQFLCELAEDAMNEHRLRDARDLLSQALATDPYCVRASIAKGKLEFGNTEYRQAIDSFKYVETQNPLYLPVVIPHLKNCWERQGNEYEAVEYLDHLYQDFGIVAAAVEVAERILKTKGTSAAIDYLLPVLEERPEPLTVSCALELLVEDRTIVSDRIQKLSTILSTLIAGTTHFHCVECGFSGHELHWCCPSCRYWGSIIPT